MTKAILLAVALLCAPARAGRLPFKEAEAVAAPARRASSMEELRMLRRFGVGISAGGPLSALGLEADINLSPEASLSVGLGTGVDYSTFMTKVRYLLLGEWVSPYIGIGVARWWTEGTNEQRLSPSVLANRFLTAGEDPTKGFNVWLAYPCAGVQILHYSGIDFYAEFQYLFRLFTFSNGTYAGLGAHWYF